ncbi:MAG TPA: hypothetical protein VNV39_07615 [Stellaceae bacterium]|nr:hypothetical protein [Stellaceae bacterium]
MSDLIALRAMFGQDEANHGTVRYRVGLDGLVLVPPEVAVSLVNNGGFAVVKPIAMGPSKPRPGDLPCNALVRLHHDTAGACSYDGSQYRADKNGDFLVPAEAVADLTAHGFFPSGRDKRDKSEHSNP